MRFFLFLSVASTVYGCARPIESPNNSSRVFSEPIVITQSGTIQRSTNALSHIESGKFLFKGVFQSSDTILIGNEWSEIVSTLNGHNCRDTFHHQANGGLQLYFSDKAVILDALHLRWGSHYYPLFIINEASNDKSLRPIIDYEIRGIQEAIDSIGKWRPINSCSIDVCSDTYDFRSAQLKPQNYAVVMTPKYDGNFQTRIRVRLEIGNNIYVSNEIDGTIDYSQFLFKKESSQYHMMIDFPGQATVGLFLGSTPLEADVFINRENNIWSKPR
jgi:hypothetical protein